MTTVTDQQILDEVNALIVSSLSDVGDNTLRNISNRHRLDLIEDIMFDVLRDGPDLSSVPDLCELLDDLIEQAIAARRQRIAIADQEQDRLAAEEWEFHERGLGWDGCMGTRCSCGKE